MKPADFFGESGVIIVAGKGGVGKTDRHRGPGRAPRPMAGLRTLVVEVEGKDGMTSMFETGGLSYARAGAGPGRRGPRWRPGPHPHSRRRPAGLPGRPGSPADLQPPRLLGAAGHRGDRGARASATSWCSARSSSSSGQRDQDAHPAGRPSRGTRDHASCARPAGSPMQCARGPINTQADEVLELLGRPAPLPGAAGDPAGGDAGQRADRDRLQPRGGRRRRAGTGGGQRRLPGAARASAPIPGRPRQAAGTHLLDHEAELLAAAAAFREVAAGHPGPPARTRMAEELPLAQLHLPYLFNSHLDREGLGHARRRSDRGHRGAPRRRRCMSIAGSPRWWTRAAWSSVADPAGWARPPPLR